MGALALTSSDLRPFEDAPRIKDLRLAEALGFEQPRDIRKLIKRNIARLEQHGQVCAMMARTSSKGGRPTFEYWLNERQAYRLCMWSAAANADAVQEQMVEVFYAYRHGHLTESNPTLAALTQRIDEIQASIRLFTISQEQYFARSLAFHPKMHPLNKPDGRRRHYKHPKFWPDIEVRERVIALCGQTEISKAADALKQEYGDRAPSRSALHRFWQKLGPVMRSAV